MAHPHTYFPSPGTPGEGEGGGSRRAHVCTARRLMKLEYVSTPAGAHKRGLIRLYDFSEHGATSLQSVFLSLAVGKIKTLALHEQSWIESLNGCQLRLILGPKDFGVRKIAEPTSFECIYHQEGWAELADKTKSFTVDHPEGFNWLTNEGDIQLLISPDGKW
jgi:hypothetical protein